MVNHTNYNGKCKYSYNIILHNFISYGLIWSRGCNNGYKDIKKNPVFLSRVFLSLLLFYLLNYQGVTEQVVDVFNLDIHFPIFNKVC